MSEISNYEAQKKKLQGLCDEHNFTFRFFIAVRILLCAGTLRTAS